MKMNLVESMEFARDVHQRWALYQEKCRRCGKEPVRHVGSATHHRRWIKIYNEVIKRLKDLGETT